MQITTGKQNEQKNFVCIMPFMGNSHSQYKRNPVKKNSTTSTSTKNNLLIIAQTDRVTTVRKVRHSLHLHVSVGKVGEHEIRIFNKVLPEYVKMIPECVLIRPDMTFDILENFMESITFEPVKFKDLPGKEFREQVSLTFSGLNVIINFINNLLHQITKSLSL